MVARADLRARPGRRPGGRRRADRYGVGGYFKTPLEETLPVEMQIKDQLRRPRLTMVFIIDKSGSMADSRGGASKVELAKEAAIRSLELLSPTDKVGVIAFDDTAAWVVPITSLDKRDAIANGIGTIRADGGTDISPGVQAAADVLPGDDAAVKHVILLTDGGADPTGIAEMITAMHDDNGITLSPWAWAGRGALPARPGRGWRRLYHFAADPSSIPAIFTEETSAGHARLHHRRRILPRPGEPQPHAGGHRRRARPAGLRGHQRQGLGSDHPGLPARTTRCWPPGSMAWAARWPGPPTPPAAGRKHWVSWDNFVRFWAQVVGYTITERRQSNVEVRVERSGDQATRDGGCADRRRGPISTG